ncbi:MAG TPA: creatininase family protein [Thermomicrobiales bacterium]|nr:creatininase family protein [Thermomicrobiales bacterium]
MATRPTTPEVRLERLTSKAIDDGSFDKAILPVGATEYHGPHLPYGTDTIGAEVLAEAFARELGNTIVLPAISYGVSHHHMPWPWTMSIRPDTMIALIQDVAESLIHHGIQKLVIVTAHDGNPGPAEAAARILSQEHDMSVALVGGWQGKSRALLAGQWDIDEDHAGQSELSIVLYAAPETARPDLATKQPNQFMDHPVSVIGAFDGTVPLGYSGDATAASAEEGEAIVHAMTGLIVPFLRDLDANGWKRGSWMSGIEG